MNPFMKDVAVSLVDDSFIFTTEGQSVPLVLPAYVAVQTGTERMLAYGDDAKSMLGREPNSISVMRVLEEGLVTDHNGAAALFRIGLKQVQGKFIVVRPRVIIACRSGNSGKVSIKNMATAGGAREVFLMEMGMATAIGMNLDVQKPEIKAVLSVSNDWFEFSVISLAGVLAGVSGAIGTNAFVEDIQNHLSLLREFRPERSAIESQLSSGGLNASSAVNLPGWEVWGGRSEQGRRTAHPVTREDITIGMMPSLIRMTERIKGSIRSLPVEKQSQFGGVTVHATGTAMRITGLSQAIANQLSHAVAPFSSEVHPSIGGCSQVLKELNVLRRVKPTKA